MEIDHCEHVEELRGAYRSLLSALRFIAISTPIILGTATFVILVVRG